MPETGEYQHRRDSRMPWVQNTSVPLQTFTPGQEWKSDKREWGNCPQKPTNVKAYQVVDLNRGGKGAQTLAIIECARKELGCTACPLNGIQGIINGHPVALTNPYFR